MKVTKCSACRNDHDNVTVVTEKSPNGDSYFKCPTNGRTVYIRSPFPVVSSDNPNAKTNYLFHVWSIESETFVGVYDIKETEKGIQFLTWVDGLWAYRDAQLFVP